MGIIDAKVASPKKKSCSDLRTRSGTMRCEGSRRGFGKRESFQKLTGSIRGLNEKDSAMAQLKAPCFQIDASQHSDWYEMKTFFESGKTSADANGYYSASTVKGVSKYLKYHFEPGVLEDENGTLDAKFLKPDLPNGYRQRLLAKYDAFFGVTQLNVTEESVSVEDLIGWWCRNCRC